MKKYGKKNHGKEALEKKWSGRNTTKIVAPVDASFNQFNQTSFSWSNQPLDLQNHLAVLQSPGWWIPKLSLSVFPEISGIFFFGSLEFDLYRLV